MWIRYLTLKFSSRNYYYYQKAGIPSEKIKETILEITDRVARLKTRQSIFVTMFIIRVCLQAGHGSVGRHFY